MEVITEHRGSIGVKPTYAALGVARATYYRQERPRTAPRGRGRHRRALSAEERHRVLEVVNSDRFCDQARAFTPSLHHSLPTSCAMHWAYGKTFKSPALTLPAGALRFIRALHCLST